MEPIFSESLKRSVVAPQVASQQPQVVFIKTNAMGYDSYENKNKKSTGSLLLKLGLVAGAIIFRKNIANVANKYFPNISKDIATAAKGAKSAIKSVKGGEYIAAGWRKYVKYEGEAKGFIVDKLNNTSIGKTIKKKALRAFVHLKNLVLKK